jgi:hypothetical protein
VAQWIIFRMRQRIIEPEILDSLPPDDPTALRNRREIILLGRLSGTYRRAASLLKRHHLPGDRVLELGCGCGELGRAYRRLHREETHYTGLDVIDRPHDWPEPWHWRQTDLLAFDRYNDHNVLVGNFILHQFEDHALSGLFTRIRDHYRLMIFCETSRHRLHMWQLRLASLLGLHPVTRHDGRLSIRGGFRKGELPAVAGLDRAQWHIKDGTTWLGCYWMIARRIERPLPSPL